MAENALHVGDNLDILRRSISDEAIDLIYLDPPFNSHATYSVSPAKRHGTPSPSRITAFDDIWTWDAASAHALRDVLRQGGRAAEAMRAFRTLLGESDMLAYLAMMAPRLIELHRVLKPTGSLYLHCDPTASHYLKVLMDAIFGPLRLQNEIIWSYQRYTARSNRFQRLHDVLLFYTRSEMATFNAPREAYGPNSGTADAHYKQEADGRWYRWQKRRGQEPYKIYLAEGRRLGDVWTIPHLNASAKERLGYPTQKPEALLERIITASSIAGDVVLDPFCGSGTTIVAAQKLDRRWIGIDITHLAIGLLKTRLRATFGPEIAQAYTVIGEPADPSPGLSPTGGEEPRDCRFCR